MDDAPPFPVAQPTKVPARLRVIERLYRGVCISAIGPEFASQYLSDPDKAWDAIVAMDPTPTKRYLQWCARLVAAGTVKPEDFYKAPALLNELQRCRPMMRRDGVSVDIGQYDSLPALAKVLAPYREQTTEGEGHRRDQARAEAESTIHHRDNELLVVEPNTEFASCFWGRGTQWCTAATEADNAFEKYTSNGNRLFIYLFRDGAKVQGCTNGEMTDAEDRRLEWLRLADAQRALMLSTHCLRELAVQLNGMALELIPADQQTERVRELAVQQNGMALRLIPADQQTERMRELAAQQNGWALGRISADQQTEKVREFAVQQNGIALGHIPADQQTERMREFAVQRNGMALGLIPVDQQTDKVRELAVEQNGRALGLIPADQQTERVRELAVQQNGGALEFIPADQQTERVRELAVQHNGWALELIPADQQTERVRELAVRHRGLSIQNIPPDQQTERVRELAVQQNGMALRLIPADQQTAKVRELAVQQNGWALRFIPSPQQTDGLKAIAAGFPVTPPPGSVQEAGTPRQVVPQGLRLR